MYERDEQLSYEITPDVITEKMRAAGVDALQSILCGWGRLTSFDEECVQAIYQAMVQASQSERSVPASAGTCSQKDAESSSGPHSTPAVRRDRYPSASSRPDAWPTLL